MLNRSLSAIALASLIAITSHAAAQNPPKPKRKNETGAAAAADKAPKSDSVRKAEKARTTHFFDSETPLTMSLTFNYKKLRGDRDATKSPWRAASLTITDSSGTDTIPIRIRTRGIWRLNHCDMPPMRIKFTNATIKNTALKGLDEPKLINYCKDFDDYEQYTLSELQVNRVYNLLTPNSHKVRLIRMTYIDSVNNKPIATHSAFIEEEPEVMASRIHGLILKQKGAGPDDVEPNQSAMFGVFNYMIGNTDWAISVLHNAELVSQDNGDLVPVTYDFDFSGAVNTRYAAPDPRLGIKIVRDRLFRGYCVPEDVFSKTFDIFKQKKDAIYALYHDQIIGKLQDPRVVDETLKYYDGFYDVINDPRRAKGNIDDACIGRR